MTHLLNLPDRLWGLKKCWIRKPWDFIIYKKEKEWFRESTTWKSYVYRGIDWSTPGRRVGIDCTLRWRRTKRKQTSPFEPLRLEVLLGSLIDLQRRCPLRIVMIILVSSGSRLIKTGMLNVCDLLYIKYTSIGHEEKMLSLVDACTPPLKLWICGFRLE